MDDDGPNSHSAQDVTAVRDSIKSGFETAKQLTTLSAGSLVLLATFLNDIFPDPLSESPTWVKWAIVGAFIAFGLSLVIATNISLVGFSNLLRSRRLVDKSTGRVSKRTRTAFRLFLVAPGFCYSLGLIFFSYAVLHALLELDPAGLVRLQISYGVICLVLGLSAVYYLVREPSLSRRTMASQNASSTETSANAEESEATSQQPTSKQSTPI
jgi:hypothetical protein